MKNNKRPLFKKTYFIGSDGSSQLTYFPYLKEDFFINPDLRSNDLWLPRNKKYSLENFSTKSKKYENFQFDFTSLIKKK